MTRQTQKRAVLVTGCSSGIGRAAALYLSEQGFTVFATVRREADAENLRSLNHLTLIPICPLDLSQTEDILTAVEIIESELDKRPGLELYAIINNAGGGTIAPIELMDVGKFRTEWEVRVLGPVALLQALMPRIREAHGRILWIATPSLLPIPFISSIHAPDFAINGLARTLQLELKPWNIPSILIRCGGILTAGPEKSARDLEADFQRWPRERFRLYAQTLEKLQAEFTEFDTRRTDPREVGRVIFEALTAEKPKRRYRIGYRSGLAAALELLPQTLVDSIMARR